MILQLYSVIFPHLPNKRPIDLALILPLNLKMEIYPSDNVIRRIKAQGLKLTLT